MATYLDFESKIEKIQEEIVSAHAISDFEAMNRYQHELDKEVQKTFGALSDFQKLRLARHPDRPYALDYIRLLMTDAYEIHGDRAFRDDPAILCYIGWIDGQKTMLIGEQKGRGVKNKIKRNFGMPNPEGYRKALRAVKMAEKFDIPVLMLIDTPGAYPGLGAEERGQSEAIAKNLFEFASVKVPMVSIVIGEGGSGGALAIGVADKLAMMRYSVFAVISPEGCSAILWNDPSKVEAATKALKITPEDLLSHKLIDDVLDEPLIGAHRDKETSAAVIKSYFLENVQALRALSVEEMLEQRYKRLTSVGAYSE
ncbi:MAG TPA: acetyl-CoA carboxylase carboxyl transferase subunit alpha [Sulfurovum sp.]|jgi:acetyl-CoA carboxylase carboxyl transferase subunit alpha|nr:MAG: acetyl-CoA carboxylase carboxyl transferase subunit alpha [Sulfurovum sp. 35-42-20]OYY56168.1 MAG: acetyl-CoA carboxylase carboxyl transferase subunit alpha [Sulfurovum sp. 28-43-6]OYZ26886.1 MAG: acetyl-CoA carboxylase carboxyl transferase subunit alpha [Sulfurovum sp. 16-42-52]OYZ49545.1 MAG: acetyl-CoA carboxylase carboxyl transferase subunit alpha [Sulfurovum sp. 24-42-9]OZA45885.1 MAG: acetyl-CoA carboxylase carboxyl transferase subunit alpha [Sulfurovum sp. 17-42-90]OZA59889.1 MA